MNKPEQWRRRRRRPEPWTSSAARPAWRRSPSEHLRSKTCQCTPEPAPAKTLRFMSLGTVIVGDGLLGEGVRPFGKLLDLLQKISDDLCRPSNTQPASHDLTAMMTAGQARSLNRFPGPRPGRKNKIEKINLLSKMFF